MKNLLVATVFALAANAVLAVSPQADETVAERARIKAERSQAEAAFAAREKACYGKFAVNDCLGEARAKRREVLADLRRQEISLNDAERRRRSAERLREIEERSSAQKQEQAVERRAQAASDQRQREERAAVKASRAASAAARPSKAPKTHEAKAAMPASEAAGNAQRHEQRVEQVLERKERVERRQAERNKTPAKPLPVPP
jgi:colicin import membrane protein